jgi:hypothetical protein
VEDAPTSPLEGGREVCDRGITCTLIQSVPHSHSPLKRERSNNGNMLDPTSSDGWMMQLQFFIKTLNFLTKHRVKCRIQYF